MTELRCPVCDRRYDLAEVAYFCPACGMVGTLDVLFDYPALAARLDRDALAASSDVSMWRWRPLLPIAPQTPITPLRVGGTPLFEAPRVAAHLGLSHVWIKDDGQNPTGSLKDRASALVTARAVEIGAPVVSAASTGNAAAALAGVVASMNAGDVSCMIFVPASAPEAKIAQLLIYGARVLLVEGSYDQAFDLCFELSLSEGWYCRNTAINPFTTEGKKTVSYEIAAGLGWQMPDVVVVSVGDGNILAGVYKGFYDLHQLGWIERIPRLIGVQAEGSRALVDAWERGLAPEAMMPMPADTIADSISAGLPRDRAKALRAVRTTGGAFVAVPDSAILAAMPALAQRSGVFAEPAAAAVFAGAQHAVQSGWIKPEESALLLLTGNGLKDVRRAQEAVGQALRVPPDPSVVREILMKAV